jgi:hypothetical protein
VALSTSAAAAAPVAPAPSSKPPAAAASASRGAVAALPPSILVAIAGPQAGRAGYCELCNLNYKDMKFHVESKEHLERARDPETFRDFDDWPTRKANFARLRAEREARQSTKVIAMLQEMMLPAMLHPRWGPWYVA